MRSASQTTDAGSGTTEQNFASVFAGVFNSKQLSTDATARQARLVVDGIYQFPCASSTFAVGDYVMATYAANALADQTVSKTTNSARAIGRVVKEYQSATTVVKCRLISKILTGGMNAASGALTATDITGTDSSLDIVGQAGSASAGGAVPITGGAGNGATNAGGAVGATGGAGGTGTTTTGGAGGAGNLTGGAGGTATTGTAGAGGASAVLGGAGGASSGAAGIGGAGGAVSMIGGVGGASATTSAGISGVGGAVTITGGAGGACAATGAQASAAGGAVTITAGASGTVAGSTAAAAGGAASFVSGAGGASTSTGAGGAGGATAITGGVGGAGSATGTGGAGSTVTVTAGAGGATSGAGTGGAGGNVNLVPGAGGTTSGGTAGAAGSVLFNGGGINVNSPAFVANTNTTIFVATRACRIVGCSCLFNATAGGTSTLNITKETTTGGPGTGTTILNANFNLNATGNTIQNGAITTGAARLLAAGDRVSTSFNHAIQSTTGLVIAMEIAPQ